MIGRRRQETTHKLRKIRKKRGSRTQGYGRIGQHRKSGSKGERKPARHKHLWSYVLRYDPDYFGKKGFKTPQSLKAKTRTINLKDLEEIVIGVSHTKRTKEAEIFLDLEKMGYTKLLGEGRMTHPVTVKVPQCSETALRKIEEAGGKVQTEKA